MPEGTDWRREARLRVLESGGVTRVRLGGFGSVMMFVAVLTAGIFVGALAWPVVAMILAPRPVPVWVLVAFATGALVVAVLAAARRQARFGSGELDLVIDDRGRTVVLPVSHGRDRAVTVEIGRITEIAPATVVPLRDLPERVDAFGPRRWLRERGAVPEHVERDTGHRGTQVLHGVLVCWREADGEIEAPIAQFAERGRARALAFWLRDRLGL